jgi:hypothetical protein
MSGDYIFGHDQIANFEDDSAAALEEAGLLEIIGDVEEEETETTPKKRGGK